MVWGVAWAAVARLWVAVARLWVAVARLWVAVVVAAAVLPLVMGTAKMAPAGRVA